MQKEKNMHTGSHEFDYNSVPSWYVLCTLSDCPLSGECLRHLIASQAPETQETALCIMPSVLKAGKCRFFNPIRKVRMARGFTHLFDNVLKSDYTAMRKTLTDYLHGSKFFYQYKRGERLLTPGQQQHIKQIMKSFGYGSDVTFDSFEDRFDFLYCI